MTVHISEVRVRYAETDAMAVAYHSNYLVWFEVGRTELLRALGYPYAKLEEDGIILPLVECSCKYKIPVRYDDELLIKARCTEMKGASLVIGYEIVNKSSGAIHATGWTKHVTADRKLKPVRLRDKNPKLHEILLEGIGDSLEMKDKR